MVFVLFSNGGLKTKQTIQNPNKMAAILSKKFEIQTVITNLTVSIDRFQAVERDDSRSETICEFLIHLSVCHSVIPQKGEEHIQLNLLTCKYSNSIKIGFI